MKRTISLFASGAFFTALVTALAAGAAVVERNVEDLRVGTEHRDLYALAQTAENSYVAVGAVGTIVVSSDGGKTWEQQDYDTDLSLLAITSAGGRQMVTGQRGLVLTRENDGQWQENDSGVDARLLGVGMNSQGLAIAVGSFGTVVRSGDFGSSWEALELNLPDRIEGGYNPHLYDAHVSEEGAITVVGEFGIILRSPDGGENWKIVNTGTASLFSLQIRDDGVGFAVGQSGYVMRTQNAGLTWSERETGLDANLLGVWSSPDGTVLVPGFRHMLSSKDGGETWSPVAGGDVNRGWYIAAQGSANNSGVLAVGHRGKIIRLTESNG